MKMNVNKDYDLSGQVSSYNYFLLGHSRFPQGFKIFIYDT
jgi:hypothetical protein